MWGWDATEVRTNNGGILDCVSSTVEYAHLDYGDDALGSATPVAAVTLLAGDRSISPPGSPQTESEADDAAVFVYTDAAENRLGRALVIRLASGWVVLWTERCG